MSQFHRKVGYELITKRRFEAWKIKVNEQQPDKEKERKRSDAVFFFLSFLFSIFSFFSFPLFSLSLFLYSSIPDLCNFL